MTRVHPLHDDQRPSEAIYNAVAELRSCSPLELPPLAGAVDTDALDTLITSDTGACEVTFEYCDTEVTVTSEAVRLQPLD